MVENATFYVFLSEYHSGFRAYSRRFLESLHFEANSDDFVFDTEIIAQGVASKMVVREVPIQTRYFDEASQIGFWRSVRYGLAILKTMVLYKLHRKGVWSHPIFRPRAPSAQPSGVRLLHPLATAGSSRHAKKRGNRGRGPQPTGCAVGAAPTRGAQGRFVSGGWRQPREQPRPQASGHARRATVRGVGDPS